MKKLKVLLPGLISPFQNFQYKIGKEYICDNFDTDIDKECSNGFYATDIEGLPYSWNINRECYEVEVDGKCVIYDIYKQRFEKQTILRKVEKDELISLAKCKENELGYLLSEVLFPINPLLIDIKNISDEDKELLKIWASVRTSVRVSVRDSVRAYISSLYPNIVKWEYIDYKEGINPYQSGIDLWRKGLVPSFDGKTYRLYGGIDAKILYRYNVVK